MTPSTASTEVLSTAGRDVSAFRLDNGMDVVVIPDHRAPVVTHMVWYRAGAADETPGVSGIAHFLEHLMFKGTKNTPEGVFSQTVAALGGQENAFTSQDYTAYFQQISKDHLAQMMHLEADRMRNLLLNDEQVVPERGVVLEERRARTDNAPDALFREAMMATLYRNHPYRTPIIGWQHEIEGLSRDDALAFYHRFYAPQNAILVVAGDVEAAAVRALAQETYGKIPPGDEAIQRRRPREPQPALAHRRVEMTDPKVSQPSLSRYYLVPSAHSATPQQAATLSVLAHVLGGSSNSRLYRSLVVNTKRAVEVGAWYAPTMLDETTLGIYGLPLEGGSLADLENAIDAEIASLIREGVSEEELARAKNALIATTIYAQDSQQSLAQMFGVTLALGGSIEDVQQKAAHLKAVSAANLREAAKTWLDRRRAVTGYLEPETKPAS